PISPPAAVVNRSPRTLRTTVRTTATATAMPIVTGNDRNGTSAANTTTGSVEYSIPHGPPSWSRIWRIPSARCGGALAVITVAVASGCRRGSVMAASLQVAGQEAVGGPVHGDQVLGVDEQVSLVVEDQVLDLAAALA